MPPTLPDFSNGRVLVVGDVMLDRYWHGSTTRISPEAPVPVVKVEADEFRAGGAGNVALNIASLGANAQLVALVGRDEAARLLRERLEGGGVVCRLLEAPQHPTITKLRVISRHQQLIRLDFEDSFAVLESAGIEEAFRNAVTGSGAIVLSDYGKGTLAEVGTLIRVAREHRVAVVVDPKGTDFGRYAGATVITPNLSEFEAVVGHCADEATLVSRGEALRDMLDLEALLITRSERGMTLLQKGAEPLNLPTQARDVFDVTGAGDTVVAVLGAGLACGLSLPDATTFANLAAGVVVGKLGTATVNMAELDLALQAATTAVRPAGPRA
ncbi:MAG: D-glycero-beta-D-manno-heptose-7-phosphate kinase [Aromatoleum sp.]|jgi:D-beta-D-heptose 7-phosphate kinase/D-beta-D-heptose 1-phosphate adenosyltransferase|uniref:D-glycero-beta-D-manno-heptose-7-phosphate kinase n=1 Tax=Aromatoleum sp. TaxID=2307007 RepID=UPI002894FFA1|nr:D-glycero-beta-D-manno-heptose-7-phosphate kinase [Aromatoleum sp.]MDT3670423.1 D-glycero-beta-D-manno-heptose-7-phosphate kinase [Aromatoleum sp.]